MCVCAVACGLWRVCCGMCVYSLLVYSYSVGMCGDGANDCGVSSTGLHSVYACYGDTATEYYRAVPTELTVYVRIRRLFSAMN